MTRSSRILMLAEIMSMSRDIKLKETWEAGKEKLGLDQIWLKYFQGI